MRDREASVTERATGIVERPALFERLSAGVADGVTLLSAAAGSGKTVLLRSWLGDAGEGTRAAWVAVEHDERDPQAFESMEGRVGQRPALTTHERVGRPTPMVRRLT